MIDDTLQRSILLFARYPEKGRVKTRLETHLTKDQIIGLYKCFVEDILSTLRKSGYPVTVCCLPSGREAEMKAWLGPEPAYIPQIGNDLGQRMENAFVQTFTAKTSPVDQAILLGSDLPDLDPGIVHQAFDSLSSNDMTLGPAVDGGFYLVGFNRHAFSKEIFDGISWGTGQVFKETMKKAKQAGLKIHVLPQWQDIDTFADLELFLRQATEKGSAHLLSIQFLHTILDQGQA